jgi:hypothetical protein
MTNRSRALAILALSANDFRALKNVAYCTWLGVAACLLFKAMPANSLVASSGITASGVAVTLMAFMGSLENWLKDPIWSPAHWPLHIGASRFEMTIARWLSTAVVSSLPLGIVLSIATWGPQRAASDVIESLYICWALVALLSLPAVFLTKLLHVIACDVILGLFLFLASLTIGKDISPRFDSDWVERGLAAAFILLLYLLGIVPRRRACGVVVVVSLVLLSAAVCFKIGSD